MNYTSAEWLLTVESKSTLRRRYCKRIDITLMSECLIEDRNMGQITQAKRLSIQWASSSGSLGWTPGCVGFHALVFAQIKQMTHKLVWHTHWYVVSYCLYDTQTQLMFGLVSLNQNKVVTYMLINLYLVCLETSPPFIHRKSGRSAQEGKGAGDWWIGAVSAVMRTVYQPAVVKRKLRLKEELSIYRSVYVLTVMYDHELWIVTEKMRFQIQGASKGSLALP